MRVAVRVRDLFLQFGRHEMKPIHEGRDLDMVEIEPAEARGVVGGWSVVESVVAEFGIAPDLQLARDRAAAGSSVLAWLAAK